MHTEAYEKSKGYYSCSLIVTSKGLFHKNHLFCDLVMQAVFEARLMEYPDDLGDDIEEKILASFFKGYGSVRSFTEEQQYWYPYLYAVIDALWSADIKWNEDSLMNAVKNGDMEMARKWLETVWQRLNSLERTSYCSHGAVHLLYGVRPIK